MAREQIFCCICGAPTIDPGHWAAGGHVRKKWLTEVVLLTTAQSTADGLVPDLYHPSQPLLVGSPLMLDSGKPSPVFCLTVEHTDGDTFYLHSGGKTRPLSVDATRLNPDAWQGAPLYLPIHIACCEIALTFIEHGRSEANPDPCAISSMSHLWDVYYRRMPMWPIHAVERQLPEPDDYQVGYQCRGLDWQPEEAPESAALLETNPLQSPHITQTVLQSIASQQHPRCFGTLDQGVISMDALAHLVHQSTATPSCDLDDTTGSPTLSARNHKRIWSLLERARIGDTERGRVNEESPRHKSYRPNRWST
ncbi:hypothetical protein BDV96DRAFT_651557 [Lophiotrema nucula]|uniref:Uncharacterized protein n=1 Tax=Lophiotrema nucula TaxID=690887 RepID=A0A6A5YSE4_9PLEO|nr:hypothetical protein BDV96DRAFT_651557 [Lophiotrema nucula]